MEWSLIFEKDRCVILKDVTCSCAKWQMLQNVSHNIENYSCCSYCYRGRVHYFVKNDNKVHEYLVYSCFRTEDIAAPTTNRQWFANESQG